MLSRTTLSVPCALLLASMLGCPGSDACFDFDEDGWCDDNDCDPEDASVNGAASEDCSDEKDNDCDGID